MKIERNTKSPDLFEWMKQNLPSSLSAGKNGEGYGYGYYIYAGSAPVFFRGNPIAEIHNSTIVLFHTNYFSDMEDLGRKYEQETGYEVTLRYWQAPKDTPLCAS